MLTTAFENRRACPGTVYYSRTLNSPSDTEDMLLYIGRFNYFAGVGHDIYTQKTCILHENYSLENDFPLSRIIQAVFANLLSAS